MARNFKIVQKSGKNGLQLQLRGDFDGSSAYELIQALEKNIDKTGRIEVNTSGLQEVVPFGCAVLHSNLGIEGKKRRRLMFTGENADSLAPAGTLVK
jgi:hypothetical protein